MWKHLAAISLFLLAVVVVAHFRRGPELSDADFRCRLPDIQCDACRGAIAAELRKNSGIRAVVFEGPDRKTLVVTHQADFRARGVRTFIYSMPCPKVSLRSSLVSIITIEAPSAIPFGWAREKKRRASRWRANTTITTVPGRCRKILTIGTVLHVILWATLMTISRSPLWVIMAIGEAPTRSRSAR